MLSNVTKSRPIQIDDMLNVNSDRVRHASVSKPICESEQTMSSNVTKSRPIQIDDMQNVNSGGDGHTSVSKPICESEQTISSNVTKSISAIDISKSSKPQSDKQKLSVSEYRKRKQLNRRPTWASETEEFGVNTSAPTIDISVDCLRNILDTIENSSRKQKDTELGNHKLQADDSKKSRKRPRTHHRSRHHHRSSHNHRQRDNNSDCHRNEHNKHSCKHIARKSDDKSATANSYADDANKSREGQFNLSRYACPPKKSSTNIVSNSYADLQCRPDNPEANTYQYNSVEQFGIFTQPTLHSQSVEGGGQSFNNRVLMWQPDCQDKTAVDDSATGRCDLQNYPASDPSSMWHSGIDEQLVNYQPSVPVWQLDENYSVSDVSARWQSNVPTQEQGNHELALDHAIEDYTCNTASTGQSDDQSSEVVANSNEGTDADNNFIVNVNNIDHCSKPSECGPDREPSLNPSQSNIPTHASLHLDNEQQYKVPMQNLPAAEYPTKYSWEEHHPDKEFAAKFKRFRLEPTQSVRDAYITYNLKQMRSDCKETVDPRLTDYWNWRGKWQMKDSPAPVSSSPRSADLANHGTDLHEVSKSMTDKVEKTVHHLDGGVIKMTSNDLDSKKLKSARYMHIDTTQSTEESLVISAKTVGVASKQVLKLIEPWRALPPQTNTPTHVHYKEQLNETKESMWRTGVFRDKTRGLDPEITQRALVGHGCPLSLAVLHQLKLQQQLSSLSKFDKDLSADSCNYQQQIAIELLQFELCEMGSFEQGYMLDVLPVSLRLTTEQHLFVSVEGCLLFMQECNLTLGCCRYLFALKTEIENAHASSGDLNSVDVQEKLGWLHMQRRRCLSEVCTVSWKQLQQMLQKRLDWYRKVATEFKKGNPNTSQPPSNEHSSYVDKRIFTLQHYLSVTAHLQRNKKGVWEYTQNKRVLCTGSVTSNVGTSPPTVSSSQPTVASQPAASDMAKPVALIKPRVTVTECSTDDQVESAKCDESVIKEDGPRQISTISISRQQDIEDHQIGVNMCNIRTMTAIDEKQCITISSDEEGEIVSCDEADNASSAGSIPVVCSTGSNWRNQQQKNPSHKKSVNMHSHRKSLENASSSKVSKRRRRKMLKHMEKDKKKALISNSVQNNDITSQSKSSSGKYATECATIKRATSSVGGEDIVRNDNDNYGKVNITTNVNHTAEVRYTKKCDALLNNETNNTAMNVKATFINADCGNATPNRMQNTTCEKDKTTLSVVAAAVGGSCTPVALKQQCMTGTFASSNASTYGKQTTTSKVCIKFTGTKKSTSASSQSRHVAVVTSIADMQNANAPETTISQNKLGNITSKATAKINVTLNNDKPVIGTDIPISKAIETTKMTKIYGYSSLENQDKVVTDKFVTTALGNKTAEKTAKAATAKSVTTVPGNKTAEKQDEAATHKSVTTLLGNKTAEKKDKAATNKSVTTIYGNKHAEKKDKAATDKSVTSLPGNKTAEKQDKTVTDKSVTTVPGNKTAGQQDKAATDKSVTIMFGNKTADKQDKTVTGKSVTLSDGEPFSDTALMSSKKHDDVFNIFTNVESTVGKTIKSTSATATKGKNIAEKQNETVTGKPVTLSKSASSTLTSSKKPVHVSNMSTTVESTDGKTNKTTSLMVTPQKTIANKASKNISAAAVALHVSQKKNGMPNKAVLHPKPISDTPPANRLSSKALHENITETSVKVNAEVKSSTAVSQKKTSSNAASDVCKGKTISLPKKIPTSTTMEQQQRKSTEGSNKSNSVVSSSGNTISSKTIISKKKSATMPKKGTACTPDKAIKPKTTTTTTTSSSGKLDKRQVTPVANSTSTISSTRKLSSKHEKCSLSATAKATYSKTLLLSHSSSRHRSDKFGDDLNDDNFRRKQEGTWHSKSSFSNYEKRSPVRSHSNKGYGHEGSEGTERAYFTTRTVGPNQHFQEWDSRDKPYVVSDFDSQQRPAKRPSTAHHLFFKKCKFVHRNKFTETQWKETHDYEQMDTGAVYNDEPSWQQTDEEFGYTVEARWKCSKKRKVSRWDNPREIHREQQQDMNNQWEAEDWHEPTHDDVHEHVVVDDIWEEEADQLEMALRKQELSISREEEERQLEIARSNEVYLREEEERQLEIARSNEVYLRAEEERQREIARANEVYLRAEEERQREIVRPDEVYLRETKERRRQIAHLNEALFREVRFREEDIDDIDWHDECTEFSDHQDYVFATRRQHRDEDIPFQQTCWF